MNLDGIDLGEGDATMVALAIALALVLGKPLGIVAFTWPANGDRRMQREDRAAFGSGKPGFAKS